MTQESQMKFDNSERLTEIGYAISYYRKKRKLSQEQLAEMAGYSRNQIQRVETANAAPSIDLLFDVAEVLQVPIEKLLEIR